MKKFFFFVEGNDDERFVKKVIEPLFDNNYYIKIITYAQKGKEANKKEFIVNYIRSIKGMKADYYFLADMDYHKCITSKKDRLKKRYKNLDLEKIIVVIKMIEGWYLAGLSDNKINEFNMKKLTSTDEITKKTFDKLKPKKIDSRIDYMIELLKGFSIETAKKKNKSFAYFVESLKSTYNLSFDEAK